MRELLLHIGLHKTGTTYLQHVLLAKPAIDVVKSRRERPGCRSRSRTT